MSVPVAEQIELMLVPDPYTPRTLLFLLISCLGAKKATPNSQVSSLAQSAPELMELM